MYSYAVEIGILRSYTLFIYEEANRDTFDEATAPINNNSTVTDQLDCGGAVQEALFAVFRKADPRYELGKQPFILKMKDICSSETPVITRATRRHIPQDNILRS
jgi:hypothetical protein